MRFNRNHSLIASMALLSLSWVISVPAQPANRTPVTLHQAIDLAQTGHCKEALLPLRRMIPNSTDKTVKYPAEMALIRCAMALDEEQTAVDTLLQLKHDEPDNPEVLYIATHYFSELGIRAAQQLQAQSPASYQARRLEAEALESQGKNDEAATIYRKIFEENPKIPGIHYRLGQIALDSAGRVQVVPAFRIDRVVDTTRYRINPATPVSRRCADLPARAGSARSMIQVRRCAGAGSDPIVS